MQNLPQQITSLCRGYCLQQPNGRQILLDMARVREIPYPTIFSGDGLDAEQLADQPPDKKHSPPPCREEHKDLCMGPCAVDIAWIAGMIPPAELKNNMKGTTQSYMHFPQRNTAVSPLQIEIYKRVRHLTETRTQRWCG